ncbi:MAG: hypothetical protein AB1601_09190 [Planctomycetota bacterium]
MRRTWPAAVGAAVFTILAAGGGVTRGDEAAIVADIESFFKTEDVHRRAELARQIAADPAFDRAKLSHWLHAADLFGPLTPGRHELSVELADGAARTVVLRIPKSYDHRQPWPLIYALHGSGSGADAISGYVARVLGDAAEQYVIAAPQSYADLIIHQPEWPPTGEHPAALLKLRQTVHVAADRVFITGYSLGGHTTWTVATLHADEFAGALPLAGTFTLLLPDLLWETFLPNLAHLPILCVWGKGDVQYGGERISPEGGIAGVNRALRERLARPDLPATMIELPEADHYNVVPPTDELRKLLARRRVHWPPKVAHTFRHIVQARAYWLEGHVWTGEQWTKNSLTIRMRAGENAYDDEQFDAAVARTYRGLLGQLSGEIAGPEIRVARKRVKELTVWIGDGMIDWERPVTLKVSGRTVFEGLLMPNVSIALVQAARTWDFDRLRWAGLRFRSGGQTEPVTLTTRFPPALGPSDPRLRP